jgi:hypothetical protein
LRPQRIIISSSAAAGAFYFFMGARARAADRTCECVVSRMRVASFILMISLDKCSPLILGTLLDAQRNCSAVVKNKRRRPNCRASERSCRLLRASSCLIRLMLCKNSLSLRLLRALNLVRASFWCAPPHALVTAELFKPNEFCNHVEADLTRFYLKLS